MKKYNPIYHKSIVDNIRASAKQANVPTETLSDERIYALFEDAYYCENPEEEMFILIREANSSVQ